MAGRSEPRASASAAAAPAPAPGLLPPLLLLLCAAALIPRGTACVRVQMRVCTALHCTAPHECVRVVTSRVCVSRVVWCARGFPRAHPTLGCCLPK